MEIIDRQHMAPPPATDSSGRAVAAGKRTLMIGETSSFLRYFDGCLGDGICAPLFQARAHFERLSLLLHLLLSCVCVPQLSSFHQNQHQSRQDAPGNCATALGAARARSRSTWERCWTASPSITSACWSSCWFALFGRFSNAYLMLLTKSATLQVW